MKKENHLQRKDQKQDEVTAAILKVQQRAVDARLTDEIPMRLDELESFVQLVKVSCESKLYDESFYRKHVYRMMYLLEDRIRELHSMTKSALDKLHSFEYAQDHEGKGKVA